MIDAFLILRGIAIGLLLAMTIVVMVQFRQIYALQLLAKFSVCVCGYLLAPILYGKTDWFYMSVVFSDASVLMFLLLMQALFDEHQRPAKATLLFGALYLTASYTELFVEHAMLIDTGSARLPIRLAMVGGTLYALYRVVRHWREDLVEARRRLRVLVSLVAGGYVLGITIVESLAGDTHIPQWVELANTLGILTSIVIFMIAALRLGTEGLLPTQKQSSPTQAAKPDDPEVAKPEVAKIVSAMEQDKCYRDMELSIRSFAQQVGVAEHRLRKLINQQLDYRNFNDFLNHYRLNEIRERLADPAEASIPVLTIAMDAGYRSMTTFNRAFRGAFEETPTEYRQKILTNS